MAATTSNIEARIMSLHIDYVIMSDTEEAAGMRIELTSKIEVLEKEIANQPRAGDEIQLNVPASHFGRVCSHGMISQILIDPNGEFFAQIILESDAIMSAYFSEFRVVSQ